MSTSYASYTRDSRDTLKRLVHARRYEQILSVVASPTADDTVLDYGCADAHLLEAMLPALPRERLWGYDPDAALLSQAAAAVKTGTHLTADSTGLLKDMRGRFTLIYCVEVCEHLTLAARDALYANIAALAAEGATVVFGVPIETGPAGCAKNLFRVSKRGRQGATLTKAALSLFGSGILRSEDEEGWYGSHIGFNHRAFRTELLSLGFAIARTRCLPVPLAGALFNNEIYFVCRVPRWLG